MHRFLNAATLTGFLLLFAENAYDSERTSRIAPPDQGTIPEVTENMPQEVQEALLDSAAQALATAIRESRRQALERGADPIPPRVRVALEPYFATQILDKARWTMAGGISLDGMMKHWFYLDGAVTVGEVIAFSDATDAQEDVELWAHELTHVDQYEELGIESFASKYVRDFASMESQASGNAGRIMTSIGATK
jgi:hypothetical protein